MVGGEEVVFVMSCNIITFAVMAIVYKLINPIDNIIYYVGFTTKELSVRYNGHLRQPLPTTKIILDMGKKPIIGIIEEGDHVNIEIEKYYIKKIFEDGCPLENKDGLINSQSWRDDLNLTINDIEILTTLKTEDKYIYILNRILKELPINSNIPVVIRIQNYINTVLNF